MKAEPHSVCGECGASVYQEHINSGIARYEGDRLLCSFCVADYERSHDATESGVFSSTADTIKLNEAESEQPKGSKIQQLAEGSLLGATGMWDDSRFRRSLHPDGSGATRCRTFHSRLSDGALEYLTNQINEWLDGNDDIAVKFVTSTIGMFEGKHTEPNLIMTLWY